MLLWSLQNSDSAPGHAPAGGSLSLQKYLTEGPNPVPLGQWPGRIASTRKGGGKGDSGSLHPAGSRVGSMGVRCDVAQLAVYSRRHGRIGALGHCYGGCKRLCSVARGGKLCWAPMCLLAQLSWAVLWSLVPGSRGTCQDVILLGTVPVVCMFPSTWSVSKTSVGALVPQEGLFVN